MIKSGSEKEVMWQQSRIETMADMTRHGPLIVKKKSVEPCRMRKHHAAMGL